MKENERLKELGRPFIQLPSPYIPDKQEIKTKLRQFADTFKRLQYEKKEREIVEAGFGNESLAS